MTNAADSMELPSSDLLAGFNDEERRRLGSFGKFRTYPAEEKVIREGRQQDCLFFLLKGLLHAVHEARGGHTPLGAIRAGEWFGEMNIFDPRSAAATVIARRDSRVWVISRAKLEEFLNQYPVLGCQLLLGVAEVLARRVRELDEKINATWEIGQVE